ncbi:MAG: hypothetical protein ACFB15_07905 [Cyclobacteriaceae bacterium]
MARPITRSITLKSGYYIEVRQKGEPKGIKIRRDTYPQIQAAIRRYEHLYEVKYLGEVKASA